MSDEVTAARRALILERLMAAANRIAPAVRPIMAESARKRPEVIGSGILLAIAERRFLLTAAHVLDAFENRSAYVDLAGTLVPLAGLARSSKPPAEGPNVDRLDVAYVLLAPETRKLRLSTDSHIALEFDRSAMRRRSGPVVGPEPRGVSGGGVFRLDSLVAGPNAEDKLVAIVMSWRREPPRCLVATRIEGFLAPISLEYPDTWPHIRDMNGRNE